MLLSADELLWYFSYGSNMHPSIFVKRRGMCALATRRARLDGFRLCFNLPVGPGERAVANVEPEPGARVWGVAYLITTAQADRLDRTEGVHMGAYARVPVMVESDGDELIEAFTYRSHRTCEGRKPSARYMELLLGGARTHSLPADYVSALEAIELAWDERLAASKASLV